MKIIIDITEDELTHLKNTKQKTNRPERNRRKPYSIRTSNIS